MLRWDDEAGLLWIEGRRLPGRRDPDWPQRIVVPLKTRLAAHVTLVGAERGDLELWTDGPGPTLGVAVLSQDDVPYALAAVPLDSCGHPSCANAGIQLNGQGLPGLALVRLLRELKDLPWENRTARHRDELWQPNAQQP